MFIKNYLYQPLKIRADRISVENNLFLKFKSNSSCIADLYIKSNENYGISNNVFFGNSNITSIRYQKSYVTYTTYNAFIGSSQKEVECKFCGSADPYFKNNWWGPKNLTEINSSRS